MREQVNICFPKPIGRLVIQNGLILIEYTDNKYIPSLFKRFWYWVLLGWRWETYDQKE